MARNQSKIMMSRRRNKNSLLMSVIVIATMKVAVASTAARSVVGKLLMSNSIFFIDVVCGFGSHFYLQSHIRLCHQHIELT